MTMRRVPYVLQLFVESSAPSSFASHGPCCEITSCGGFSDMMCAFPEKSFRQQCSLDTHALSLSILCPEAWRLLGGPRRRAKVERP